MPVARRACLEATAFEASLAPRAVSTWVYRSQWLWADDWLHLEVEQEGGYDQFADAMQDAFRAVHSVTPLVEVQCIGQHELLNDSWTVWSMAQQTVPSPVPEFVYGRGIRSSFGDRQGRLAVPHEVDDALETWRAAERQRLEVARAAERQAELGASTRLSIVEAPIPPGAVAQTPVNTPLGEVRFDNDLVIIGDLKLAGRGHCAMAVTCDGLVLIQAGSFRVHDLLVVGIYADGLHSEGARFAEIAALAEGSTSLDQVARVEFMNLVARAQQLWGDR